MEIKIPIALQKYVELMPEEFLESLFLEMLEDRINGHKKVEVDSKAPFSETIDKLDKILGMLQKQPEPQASKPVIQSANKISTKPSNAHSVLSCISGSNAIMLDCLDDFIK